MADRRFKVITLHNSQTHTGIRNIVASMLVARMSVLEQVAQPFEGP